MKVHHNTLGECEFLLHFEGKKNQLVLVKSALTETSKGISGILPSMKPRHWLLWGNLDMKIEDLGATCLLLNSGYNYSQSKATEMFMKVTSYVDNLTIDKIKNV